MFPLTSRRIMLLLMLSYAPAGFAVGSEAGEKIQVQANYMRFDMSTGSSVYEGEVKISQGSIQLHGDRIVIRREQDEIQQIDIDGRPARYTQDDDNENAINASSRHMQYLTSEHQLTMTVDARLEQPNHTIESQRIVYDTKNKIVIAGDDQQAPQGGRVNITLTPKKDKPAAPAKTENP